MYFLADALAKFLGTLQSKTDHKVNDSEDSNTADESDVDTDEPDVANASTSLDHGSSIHQKMFLSALHFRSKLEKQNVPLTAWPPQSTDLTEMAAQNAVPLDLFNAMAFITGLSDSQQFEDYANIKESRLERKLMSICQDILYL